MKLDPMDMMSMGGCLSPWDNSRDKSTEGRWGYTQGVSGNQKSGLEFCYGKSQCLRKFNFFSLVIMEMFLRESNL